MISRTPHSAPCAPPLRAILAAFVAYALVVGCGGSGGGGGGGAPTAPPGGGSSGGGTPGGGGSGGGSPGGGGVPPHAHSPAEFVNWENLGVHPIDLTPDGRTLLVCNTADHRLDLLDVSGPTPVLNGSISVGLDPVSVRARTDSEAWVANHISDTVSVVDLAAGTVRLTIQTPDEPSDVVFAGTPQRAFITCSQADTLLVVDPANPTASPITISLDAEEPRALTVSADGAEVYVAFFESGNGTTALGGGIARQGRIGFPPNVVSDPAGPHGGTNPPPNGPSGTFEPPLHPGNPAPPPVSLIVRQDATGAWLDDTSADWTSLVAGTDADLSGRVPGWSLPDRDVAIVDTASLSVRYVARCMNICSAIAVNPASGDVTVVGTDATNEIRFEPNLRSTFVRVHGASFDPAAPAPAAAITDLNPHLDYSVRSVAPTERDRALGDPRGIVWSPDGSRAFVTGLGSGNVVVVDASLDRVGRVEVGDGPTGVTLTATGDRAYVLNRFDMTVSVIDTAALVETARVPLFDPTPPAVRRGRPHLYDTHATSGLGQVSCASCHVEARMDRLAWDLGDPAGAVAPFDGNCLAPGQPPCEDHHPMKGPMLTQTLQDIIGKEPHHWRGDRSGLEEFSGAFQTLLGADAPLDAAAMQELEDFLATVHFPPNPNRTLDNDLPALLDLPGQTTPGRFSAAGQPLPAGDAQEGLRLYRRGTLAVGTGECVTCHTLPTGLGADLTNNFTPIPPGPQGERHHAIVSIDGTTNVSMKVPQLRNLHERTGFDTNALENTAGFGFLHDGSVDTIARFVSEPVFTVRSDQEIADLTAFLLCFSGSDLPAGQLGSGIEPPGSESRDAHAAMGRQVTFGAARPNRQLDRMRQIADTAGLELIAKGHGRGWWFDPSMRAFRTDRARERILDRDLRALAVAGAEITFTLVPRGMGWRLGVDRDDDGAPDRTEIEAGTDPADPADVP